MGYLENAGVFLIKTAFGLFLTAVLLRVLLAVARADFYHPVSQFIVRVTNPALRPLRRLLPALGGVDTAAWTLLLVMKLIELYLIAGLSGTALHPAGALLLAVAELMRLVILIYLVSILIEVVLSWVNPAATAGMGSLLYQFNQPLLAPARRLIRPMGGLDLSPLIVLILLQLVSMLVVAPLTDAGWQLALGKG